MDIIDKVFENLNLHDKAEEARLSVAKKRQAESRNLRNKRLKKATFGVLGAAALVVLAVVMMNLPTTQPEETSAGSEIEVVFEDYVESEAAETAEVEETEETASEATTGATSTAATTNTAGRVKSTATTAPVKTVTVEKVETTTATSVSSRSDGERLDDNYRDGDLHNVEDEISGEDAFSGGGNEEYEF